MIAFGRQFFAGTVLIILKIRLCQTGATMLVGIHSEALIRNFEGITVLYTTTLQAPPKPTPALFGRSMRKGMRRHTTLVPGLDGVIPYLIGRAHGFFNIPAVEILLIVVGPYKKCELVHFS